MLFAYGTVLPGGRTILFGCGDSIPHCVRLCQGFFGRMSESPVYAPSRCGDCSGTCPAPLYMHRNRCGDCIGRMSDVLLLHRHDAVVSGFLVCFSGILIMQLCRYVSFTPRGGGQRDREGFANLSLSLQHLSTLSGEPLRRGNYR